MKAKLFVSDMDGTLLNTQREVTPGVKDAIARAVDAGAIFTVATGRMHKSALPHIKGIGLEVPIITYNGALIKTTDGKELFASYLDEAIVKDLLDFAFEAGLHIQLYSDDELYFAFDGPRAQRYCAAAGVEGHAVGKDMYKHMDRVPKMLIIAENSQQGDQLVARIKSEFGERIEAVKSTEVYIELIKPGVNKASAIARLAELYDISSDQVLAIGDSNNDISMIKAASYGVAMGNANSDVRDAADYYVADNNHDGVAEAIERFCLD